MNSLNKWRCKSRELHWKFGILYKKWTQIDNVRKCKTEIYKNSSKCRGKYRLGKVSFGLEAKSKHKRYTLNSNTKNICPIGDSNRRIKRCFRLKRPVQTTHPQSTQRKQRTGTDMPTVGIYSWHVSPWKEDQYSTSLATKKIQTKLTATHSCHTYL